MLYILAQSREKGSGSMRETEGKYDPSCRGVPDRRAGTALVTGASRGIGLAIAQALAADGWNLVLTCSQTVEEMETAALAISEQSGVRVRCRCCDMGDSASVRDLFGDIRALDLLVNNAGIAWYGLLQDMTDGEWDRILSVNLSSVFYTCRAAIPIFLQRGSGRIINISSVWGNAGASCEAAYSASKGGVNALTKALAKELAPSGIPVNAIACGCVDTQMNRHLNMEERASLSGEIPAGRFAEPEEIAACVLHLARMPSYLTGQIITVDGGWT